MTNWVKDFDMICYGFPTSWESQWKLKLYQKCKGNFYLMLVTCKFVGSKSVNPRDQILNITMIRLLLFMKKLYKPLGFVIVMQQVAATIATLNHSE